MTYKMQPKLQEIADACGLYLDSSNVNISLKEVEFFAEQVIKVCIGVIETYRISVGNSPAGEMACEWTYEALKEIRDSINETFDLCQKQ